MPEMAVWSGDTVKRDEEGYIYFISRRDEMIKTSSYRVSPTEVEEVIYASGLISEAAAFGVAHPTLGQAIVVVVMPKPGNQFSAELLLPSPKQNYLHLWCRIEIIFQCREFAAKSERQNRSKSPRATIARFICCDNMNSAKPGHAPMVHWQTADGDLLVNGVALTRLVARVGQTPFFAYDRALLRDRVTLLRRHIPAKSICTTR